MNNTIELTPTWAEALNICLVVLESGTHVGKELAKQELRNMAKLADAYVENEKMKGEH